MFKVLRYHFKIMAICYFPSKICYISIKLAGNKDSLQNNHNFYSDINMSFLYKYYFTFAVFLLVNNVLPR